MSEMELDVGPGRGYRYYTGTPVYPFGAGLSLTTFSLTLSGPASSSLTTEATPSTTLSYTITVKNTGSRAGDTVVQAYFRPQSTPSQPASKLIQQLVDYERVHLEPGASAQVPFTVTTETLRLVDKATGAWVSSPGTFTLSFEDGATAPVTASVTITGSEVLVAAFPF